MRFIKGWKINYFLLLTRPWFFEKGKLGVMSSVAQTMEVIVGSRCEAEHSHSLRNMVPCYLLMELGDSRSAFVCTCVLSLSSEQGWPKWPQTYLHPTQISCFGLWQTGENQRSLQLTAADCLSIQVLCRIWSTVAIPVSTGKLSLLGVSPVRCDCVTLLSWPSVMFLCISIVVDYFSLLLPWILIMEFLSCLEEMNLRSCCFYI